MSAVGSLALLPGLTALQVSTKSRDWNFVSASNFGDIEGLIGAILNERDRSLNAYLNILIRLLPLAGENEGWSWWHNVLLLGGC